MSTLIFFWPIFRSIQIFFNSDFWFKSIIKIQIIRTISRNCIYVILWDQLEMRNVSACWVPQQFTGIHFNQHRATALIFLTGFNNGGNTFLNHTIRGNETWIHCWTPQSKWCRWVGSTLTKNTTRISISTIVENGNGYCFLGLKLNFIHHVPTTGLDNHFYIRHSFMPTTGH